MKKWLVLLSIAVCVSSAAYAESTKVGPDAVRAARREEMKAIKQQMKQKQAAAPRQPGESKWEKFWANEGERSGLAQSGSRTGNFFKNLNPAPFFKNQQERYNERKSAGVQKGA